MMKNKVDVFGPWPHLWGFDQLQITTDVLKCLAIYRWNGALLAYTQPIDLCHEIDHGNDPLKDWDK
jgi:hypothetical protein